MRRKVIIFGLAAVAALAVLKIGGSAASAKPTFSGPCASCHAADPAVALAVDATANSDGFTTYSFAVTGPYAGATGYGVFDEAGNKIVSGYDGSGSFRVANGGTYTVYGVNKDPGGMGGVATTTVQPTTPAQPTATPTATPAQPTATPTATPTVVTPVLPPSLTTASKASKAPGGAELTREGSHWALQGTLQGIAGSIWTVGSVTVTVPASANLVGGEPTAGAEVDIKAVRAADGRLVAWLVKVERPKDKEDREGEDGPKTTHVGIWGRLLSTVWPDAARQREDEKNNAAKEGQHKGDKKGEEQKKGKGERAD